MTQNQKEKQDESIYFYIFSKKEDRQAKFLKKHETTSLTGLILSDPKYGKELVEYEKKNILIALAFVVSMLIAFYQVAHPKQPVVYASASDSNHSLMQLTTIPTPINSIPIISEWVTESTVSALSLDFYDYKSQLADMRQNFTDTGWQSYNDALNDGYLDSIIANKYMVDAIPNGTIVMTHNATASEPFWEFQLPMLVTFHIGNVAQNSNRLIDIKVIPVMTSKNPHGHAIESINLGTEG